MYILAFKKKEKKFYVMNTKKLVSIGLPVLNGEEFLEDAIQSVLNQTYTKLELIISDNASTDETRKLCKKYAQKDKRIKIFRQPIRISPGDNFKFVLDKSNGAYFMWLAHDDAIGPNWLDHLIPLLKTGNYTAARGVMIYTDNEGYQKIIAINNFEIKNYNEFILADETKHKAHYFYSLFKTEIVNNLIKENPEILNGFYHNDVFFVSLLLKRGSLICSRQTFHVSRWHKNSAGSIAGKKIRSIKRLLFNHPLSFYSSIFKYQHNKNFIDAIFLCILKLIKSQFEFWIRGLKKLINK